MEKIVDGKTLSIYSCNTKFSLLSDLNSDKKCETRICGFCFQMDSLNLGTLLHYQPSKEFFLHYNKNYLCSESFFNQATVQNKKLKLNKNFNDECEPFGPTFNIKALYNTYFSDGIWIHQYCMIWVLNKNTQFNIYNRLESSLIKSLTQQCDLCKNFGAHVKCDQFDCSKFYHLPCIIQKNSFCAITQNIVVCSEHVTQSFIASKGACINCTKGIDNINDFLNCIFCGCLIHNSCFQSSHSTLEDKNMPNFCCWTCNQCKMCQICQSLIQGSEYVICNYCNKFYHPNCLDSPFKPTSSNIGWMCKSCRLCSKCGSEIIWEDNMYNYNTHPGSICEACSNQKDDIYECLLCKNKTDPNMLDTSKGLSDLKFTKCTKCERYIHMGCDPFALISPSNLELYVCLLCRQVEPLPNDSDMTQLQPVITEHLDSIMDSVDNNILPITYNGTFKESVADINQESLKFKSPHPISNSFSPSSSSFDTSSSFLKLKIKTVENNNNYMVVKSQNLNNETFQSHGTKGGESKKRCCIKRNQSSAENDKRAISNPFDPRDLDKSFGMKDLLQLFNEKFMENDGESGSNGDPGRPDKERIGIKFEAPSIEDEDDEPSYIPIFISIDDVYCRYKDMCVCCGSFGIGSDSQYVYCFQCGQSYHPFCVSLQFSLKISFNGWRCFKCIICESCGRTDDESRLILCDECDTAYHIYCLHPPLSSIPKGAWKCPNCVKCKECHRKDPGKNCFWINLPSCLPTTSNVSSGNNKEKEDGSSNNDSLQRTNVYEVLCGPCGSKEICPLCKKRYTNSENEIIMECSTCFRWVHGVCEDIKDDWEAGHAIEKGFICRLCKTFARRSSNSYQQNANFRSALPPIPAGDDGTASTYLSNSRIRRKYLKKFKKGSKTFNDDQNIAPKPDLIETPTSSVNTTKFEIPSLEKIITKHLPSEGTRRKDKIYNFDLEDVEPITTISVSANNDSSAMEVVEKLDDIDLTKSSKNMQLQVYIPSTTITNINVPITSNNTLTPPPSTFQSIKSEFPSPLEQSNHYSSFNKDITPLTTIDAEHSFEFISDTLINTYSTTFTDGLSSKEPSSSGNFLDNHDTKCLLPTSLTTAVTPMDQNLSGEKDLNISDPMTQQATDQLIINSYAADVITSKYSHHKTVSHKLGSGIGGFFVRPKKVPTSSVSSENQIGNFKNTDDNSVLSNQDAQSASGIHVNSMEIVNDDLKQQIKISSPSQQIPVPGLRTDMMEMNSTFNSFNSYDQVGFSQEKTKRKRTPKKRGYISENYPYYLQELFFGDNVSKSEEVERKLVDFCKILCANAAGSGLPPPAITSTTHSINAMDKALVNSIPSALEQFFIITSPQFQDLFTYKQPMDLSFNFGDSKRLLSLNGFIDSCLREQPHSNHLSLIDLETLDYLPLQPSNDSKFRVDGFLASKFLWNLLFGTSTKKSNYSFKSDELITLPQSLKSYFAMDTSHPPAITFLRFYLPPNYFENPNYLAASNKIRNSAPSSITHSSKNYTTPPINCNTGHGVPNKSNFVSPNPIPTNNYNNNNNTSNFQNNQNNNVLLRQGSSSALSIKPKSSWVKGRGGTPLPDSYYVTTYSSTTCYYNQRGNLATAVLSPAVPSPIPLPSHKIKMENSVMVTPSIKSEYISLNNQQQLQQSTSFYYDHHQMQGSRRNDRFPNSTIPKVEFSKYCSGSGDNFIMDEKSLNKSFILKKQYQMSREPMQPKPYNNTSYFSTPEEYRHKNVPINAEIYGSNKYIVMSHNSSIGNSNGNNINNYNNNNQHGPTSYKTYGMMSPLPYNKIQPPPPPSVTYYSEMGYLHNTHINHQENYNIRPPPPPYNINNINNNMNMNNLVNYRDNDPRARINKVDVMMNNPRNPYFDREGMYGYGTAPKYQHQQMISPQLQPQQLNPQHFKMYNYPTSNVIMSLPPSSSSTLIYSVGGTSYYQSGHMIMQRHSSSSHLVALHQSRPSDYPTTPYFEDMLQQGSQQHLQQPKQYMQPRSCADDSFTSNLDGTQINALITSPQMGGIDEKSSLNTQKNLVRWLNDEALGSLATISPVLYANLKYPNLKTDIPDDLERSRQMAKLWRNISPEERIPFLQKARENRALLRMQKSQQKSSDNTSNATPSNPLTPNNEKAMGSSTYDNVITEISSNDIIYETPVPNTQPAMDQIKIEFSEDMSVEPKRQPIGTNIANPHIQSQLSQFKTFDETNERERLSNDMTPNLINDTMEVVKQQMTQVDITNNIKNEEDNNIFKQKEISLMNESSLNNLNSQHNKDGIDIAITSNNSYSTLYSSSMKEEQSLNASNDVNIMPNSEYGGGGDASMLFTSTPITATATTTATTHPIIHLETQTAILHTNTTLSNCEISSSRHHDIVTENNNLTVATLSKLESIVEPINDVIAVFQKETDINMVSSQTIPSPVLESAVIESVNVTQLQLIITSSVAIEPLVGPNSLPVTPSYLPANSFYDETLNLYVRDDAMDVIVESCNVPSDLASILLVPATQQAISVPTLDSSNEALTDGAYMSTRSSQLLDDILSDLSTIEETKGIFKDIQPMLGKGTPQTTDDVVVMLDASNISNFNNFKSPQPILSQSSSFSLPSNVNTVVNMTMMDQNYMANNPGQIVSNAQQMILSRPGHQASEQFQIQSTNLTIPTSSKLYSLSTITDSHSNISLPCKNVKGDKNEPTYHIWLAQKDQSIQISLNMLSQDITKMRKRKKSLASKQRQIRKNSDPNATLPLIEAQELATLMADIGAMQKKIESLRKELKQHRNLISEVQLKDGDKTLQNIKNEISQNIISTPICLTNFPVPSISTNVTVNADIIKIPTPTPIIPKQLILSPQGMPNALTSVGMEVVVESDTTAPTIREPGNVGNYEISNQPALPLNNQRLILPPHTVTPSSNRIANAQPPLVVSPITPTPNPIYQARSKAVEDIIIIKSTGENVQQQLYHVSPYESFHLNSSFNNQVVVSSTFSPIMIPPSQTLPANIFIPPPSYSFNSSNTLPNTTYFINFSMVNCTLVSSTRTTTIKLELSPQKYASKAPQNNPLNTNLLAFSVPNKYNLDTNETIMFQKENIYRRPQDNFQTTPTTSMVDLYIKKREYIGGGGGGSGDGPNIPLTDYNIVSSRSLYLTNNYNDAYFIKPSLFLNNPHAHMGPHGDNVAMMPNTTYTSRNFILPSHPYPYEPSYHPSHHWNLNNQFQAVPFASSVPTPFYISTQSSTVYNAINPMIPAIVPGGGGGYLGIPNASSAYPQNYYKNTRMGYSSVILHQQPLNPMAVARPHFEAKYNYSNNIRSSYYHLNQQYPPPPSPHHQQHQVLTDGRSVRDLTNHSKYYLVGSTPVFTSPVMTSFLGPPQGHPNAPFYQPAPPTLPFRYTNYNVGTNNSEYYLNNTSSVHTNPSYPLLSSEKGQQSKNYHHNHRNQHHSHNLHNQQPAAYVTTTYIHQQPNHSRLLSTNLPNTNPNSNKLFNTRITTTTPNLLGANQHVKTLLTESSHDTRNFENDLWGPEEISLLPILPHPKCKSYTDLSNSTKSYLSLSIVDQTNNQNISMNLITSKGTSHKLQHQPTLFTSNKMFSKKLYPNAITKLPLTAYANLGLANCEKNLPMLDKRFGTFKLAFLPDYYNEFPYGRFTVPGIKAIDMVKKCPEKFNETMEQLKVILPYYAAPARPKYYSPYGDSQLIGSSTLIKSLNDTALSNQLSSHKYPIKNEEDLDKEIAEITKGKDFLKSFDFTPQNSPSSPPISTKMEISDILPAGRMSVISHLSSSTAKGEDIDIDICDAPSQLERVNDDKASLEEMMYPYLMLGSSLTSTNQELEEVEETEDGGRNEECEMVEEEEDGISPCLPYFMDYSPPPGPRDDLTFNYLAQTGKVEIEAVQSSPTDIATVIITIDNDNKVMVNAVNVDMEIDSQSFPPNQNTIEEPLTLELPFTGVEEIERPMTIQIESDVKMLIDLNDENRQEIESEQSAPRLMVLNESQDSNTDLGFDEPKDADSNDDYDAEQGEISVTITMEDIENIDHNDVMARLSKLLGLKKPIARFTLERCDKPSENMENMENNIDAIVCEASRTTEPKTLEDQKMMHDNNVTLLTRRYETDISGNQAMDKYEGTLDTLHADSTLMSNGVKWDHFESGGNYNNFQQNLNTDNVTTSTVSYMVPLFSTSSSSPLTDISTNFYLQPTTPIDRCYRCKKFMVCPFDSVILHTKPFPHNNFKTGLKSIIEPKPTQKTLSKYKFCSDACATKFKIYQNFGAQSESKNNLSVRNADYFPNDFSGHSSSQNNLLANNASPSTTLKLSSCNSLSKFKESSKNFTSRGESKSKAALAFEYLSWKNKKYKVWTTKALQNLSPLTKKCDDDNDDGLQLTVHNSQPLCMEYILRDDDKILNNPYQPVPHYIYRADTTTDTTNIIPKNETAITLPPYLDSRICEFCKDVGDGAPDQSSRLLNMDLNKWVHLNCALWSSLVYETIGGALMNVQLALQKCGKTKCSRCGQIGGASCQCDYHSCDYSFHFPCALAFGCYFLDNKTVLCPNHYEIQKQKRDSSSQEISSKTTDNFLQPIETLICNRRVYIERDIKRQLTDYVQNTDKYVLRLGTIVLSSIGYLLPEHLTKFHTFDYFYPVNYTIVRYFWDYEFHPTPRSSQKFYPIHLYRRAYECKILEGSDENINHNLVPQFSVTPIEITINHHNSSEQVDKRLDVSIMELVPQNESSHKINCFDAWIPYLKKIAILRSTYQELLSKYLTNVRIITPSPSINWDAEEEKALMNISPKITRLICSAVRGEDFYGLTEPVVIRCIESLPLIECAMSNRIKSYFTLPNPDLLALMAATTTTSYLDLTSHLTSPSTTLVSSPTKLTGTKLIPLSSSSPITNAYSPLKYRFKYGRNQTIRYGPFLNPTGSARSEPLLRTHFRRSYIWMDIELDEYAFDNVNHLETVPLSSNPQTSAPFTSSLHSSPSTSFNFSGNNNLNLPSNPSSSGTNQLMLNKTSQYRKMKREWKRNVFLGKSRIEGLGLFAARYFDRDQMIIEYIGEIIRSENAEVREKRSGTDITYLFRLDDSSVLDAAHSGGPARYINHSCDPNCRAQNITVFIPVSESCNTSESLALPLTPATFENDLNALSTNTTPTASKQTITQPASGGQIKVKKIVIVANRKISRGEELCYDYKFDYEGENSKIPCYCGAPNCKKWMN